MAGNTKDFQPRNRGQLEDAQDRGAAETAQRLNREQRDASPHQDSDWEARVERGEEWTTEKVPEREARGDEEPDSDVSRRGLVNPPPEE